MRRAPLDDGKPDRSILRGGGSSGGGGGGATAAGWPPSRLRCMAVRWRRRSARCRNACDTEGGDAAPLGAAPDGRHPVGDGRHVARGAAGGAGPSPLPPRPRERVGSVFTNGEPGQWPHPRLPALPPLACRPPPELLLPRGLLRGGGGGVRRRFRRGRSGRGRAAPGNAPCPPHPPLPCRRQRPLQSQSVRLPLLRTPPRVLVPAPLPVFPPPAVANVPRHRHPSPADLQTTPPANADDGGGGRGGGRRPCLWLVHR